MTKDIRITLVYDPFGICAEAGRPVRNVQDEVVAFRLIEDLLRRDERFETVTPKTYIVDPECWEHFQSYRGVSGVAFHEVTPRTRLADLLGQKPPEWLSDQNVLDWQLLNWELAEDSVDDWSAALAERLVPGIREVSGLAAWLRLATTTRTTPCVGNCEPLRHWFRVSFVQAAQTDGVPGDVSDRLVANLEEVDNPKQFAAEWLRRRALLPLADFSAGNPLRALGVDLGSPSQRVTARYLPLVFPLPESFHAEVCQKMRQVVRSARLQHADAFEEAVLRLEALWSDLAEELKVWLAARPRAMSPKSHSHLRTLLGFEQDDLARRLADDYAPAEPIPAWPGLEDDSAFDAWISAYASFIRSSFIRSDW